MKKRLSTSEWKRSGEERILPQARHLLPQPPPKPFKRLSMEAPLQHNPQSLQLSLRTPKKKRITQVKQKSAPQQPLLQPCLRNISGNSWKLRTLKAIFSIALLSSVVSGSPASGSGSSSHVQPPPPSSSSADRFAFGPHSMIATRGFPFHSAASVDARQCAEISRVTHNGEVCAGICDMGAWSRHPTFACCHVCTREPDHSGPQPPHGH